MASRISNLASSNLLLSHLIRTQARLEDTQLQVSSGKVSQDYLGISRHAQGLLLSESSLSIYRDYIASNETADIRMSVSEVTMGAMQTTMNDFRKILKSLTSGSADEEAIRDAQDWAFRTMKDMESYLNTEADGRYIYSGTRVTTLPVSLNLDTLSAFQAKYDGYRTTYPTTRDAHLSEFSMSKDTKTTAQYTNLNNWMVIRRDGDADATTSSPSRIEATAAGQFSNLKAGSTITLSNTASNNGTYTIKSVASDGSYIDVVTTMLTDEAFDDGLNAEVLTAAHTGNILLASGSNVTDTSGDFTFDASADTITVTTGTPFANAKAGEVIVVSGTGSNNGTYTIDSVVSSTQIRVRTTTTATITPKDGTAIAYADTGSLVFDRSADTITATTANAFSAVTAGQSITVAGTTQNNGEYMVKSVSSDGKTITIESKKLTDEGVTGGTKFFDYTAGTQSVFNKAAGTITAQNYAGTNMADTFSNLQVGDSFTVSGTSVAPKLYTQVRFVDNGVGDTDTIQVVASDGTTPVPGYFHGVNVGDTVNVSGATTPANDAAYVVNWVSEDGSQIRVNTGINTAETVATSVAFTGTTITNFTTGTRLQFADGGAGDDIIYMRDNTGAGTIAGAFDNMSVGMTVTVANAVNAANNGTFRITAVNSAGGYITVQTTAGADAGLVAGVSQSAPETTISTTGNDGTYKVGSITNNGATITVDATTPLAGDQTDKNGAVVAASTRGFTHTTGTKLVISDGGTAGVAGDDTIIIKNITSGAADAEALKGVRAGLYIKLTGTDNDGTYKIKTVNAATGTLTLDTAIAGVSGTFVPNPGATASIEIFAADGKIEASSYYNGDAATISHRLDADRTIDPNITAIDPAFEKVIRALGIIAQGTYGTKGGLDQNTARITEAIYLMDSALGNTPSGTPPYGTELAGDIESRQRELAFDRLVIQQTNKRHESLSTFMEKRIVEIENVDQVDAISRLLDDSRTLEASYQSLSRIRQLSLINFL